MNTMKITATLILISSTISFSLFFPITAIHAVATHTDGVHVCSEENFCSPDGPAVRFPFILLSQQPEYCGYDSSYILHCDELNQTILELPSSSPIQFIVTNISYSSLKMIIQPLDTCFPKLQLRDFDLSTTPFQFESEDDQTYQSYSLFNCSMLAGRMNASSSKFENWPSIGCLRSNAHEVYAISLDSTIWSVSEQLESCKKMYNTGIIPKAMLDSEPAEMSWSMPVCQRCEVGGGICGWEIGTSSRIGCIKKYRQHFGIWKILTISGSSMGFLLLVLAINRVCNGMKQHRKNELVIRKFLEDYEAMKPTRYSYADIKKITNDFKDKLGEGGYGNVFKGQASEEIPVAVKLLHDSSGNGDEFLNEVRTIGTIHHVNIVRLLGFCADGYKRALVYEFLPNGSLDKFIFTNGEENCSLGMEKLQDIAIGIARGIKYLHQGCEQRILHFDIKPHNILLDENYVPKISDFGLAKLCEKGESKVSMTAARGTMGYIAPEVFSWQFGNVSYKSDIYSFGMLLLEMVGRRKNIDTAEQNSQVCFTEWIYEGLVSGEGFRIQVEEDDRQEEIAKNLAIAGLLCIKWNPNDRPSITSVLQMLEGNGDDLGLPSNPFNSHNE